MASISPSSSPRWDSRNQGFISPAQLQQWKQQQRASTHDFPSDLQSPPPHQDPHPQLPMGAQSSAGPSTPAAPPAPTHTRTTSSFSLFKHKHSQQDTPQPPIPPNQQQNAPNDASKQSNVLKRRSPDKPLELSTSGDVPQTTGEQGASAPNRTSTTRQPEPLPPLHPEIKSIVNLTLAHGQKIYFSGPMVRKLERQPDGQKPAKDEGWRDVWAQLGGTTLSLWDMKEIEEASKQGRQVPPSYINVTDAFVQVVGAISIPAMGNSPPQKYMNVFTLNTAGLNMLLFSCPTTQALISWVAALRLSAWEKSRLEEMYTAHLLRITLNDGRDAPSPLVRGRMEGWVRIRLAGQTDWKRLWMVVTAGGAHQDGASVSSTDVRPGSPNAPPRKKRMSNLFSREKSPPRPVAPAKPILQLFASPKHKDRKKALLSFREVNQAFAVYPERPELISRSTLMKLEGQLGDEEMAGMMKNKEGWLLIMPEFEGGNSRASEMLKWLIGIHDAFELYGRPRIYSWDPRDPQSMMFAYPIGPHKELLFLDREFAEGLEIRDDRTSTVRVSLRRILWDRMRGPASDRAPPPVPKDEPPSLPPLPVVSDLGHSDQPQASGSQQPAQASMHLPPLDFEREREHATPTVEASAPRALSPITERSVAQDASRSHSGEQHPSNRPSLSLSPPHPVPDVSQESDIAHSVYAGIITMSPSATSASPSDVVFNTKSSEGSHNVSRPDSKLSHLKQQSPPLPNAPGLVTNGHSAKSTETDLQSNATSRPMSPEAELQTFAANVRRAASPQWERQSFTTISNTQSSPHSPPPTGSQAANQFGRSSPHTASPAQSAFSGRATSPAQGSGVTTLRDVTDHPPSIRPVSSRNNSVDTFPLPSPMGMNPPSPVKKVTAPVPQTKEEDEDNMLGDAGAALHYMRHLEGDNARPPRFRHPPPPIANEDEEEESTDSGSAYTPPPRQSTVSPLRVQKPASPPPPAAANSPPRRAAGMRTGFDQASQASSNRSSTATANQAVSGPLSDQATAAAGTPATSRYSNVVAKPSGARAAPGNKMAAASSSRREPPLPAEPSSSYAQPNEQYRGRDMHNDESAEGLAYAAEPERRQSEEHGLDDTADALAALTFLDREEQPSTSQKGPIPGSPPLPQVVEPPRDGSPQPSTESHQYRSSFAPSRSAAERKAKAQAQQAAHQVAVTKPGRVNGKAKVKKEGGAWAESSDEEEEEEEEEDDEDADSDEEAPPRRGRQEQNAPSASASMAGRPGYPGSVRGVSPGGSVAEAAGAFPQARRPRDLPQVPGMSGEYSNELLGPQPPQSRRFVSDQYSDAGRRSMYPDGSRRGASPQPNNNLRSQAEFPQPGAARQSMWSQVLEPGRPQPENHGRDTFVNIEPVEATMTKAFTPHGLLSAGLQDKQDRSAKRQEELARETGASLINVPNKPPPPQTGLLGAVTAHERERKRDGGLGATLTEREREKRLAEDRQRKLDEYQRMQLEQMQQTGSMYGMPQMGYNPMMGNPMMSNPMMPMMTGGWGGYPGMMNPQHMFAAQQAAQAYQQAMMAFSVAGSQAGPDGGNQTPLNPMMTGAGMMDPRMSMMSLMSPAMGMNPAGMGMPGMSPMGGMGMGQGMNPMGMGMGPQMTGGSFDPRFSQGFGGGLGTPSEMGAGTGSSAQRPYSSQNSTVAAGGGQGSPAAFRSGDSGVGEPPRNAANASPSVPAR
ncbi:unnamed protein product [Somion occarium]|uniref:PH domain-containing protein n=1 Tax=Somion occarium TaxID=3059160 RepID=A0ABP1E9H4_9APHY